MLDETKMSEKEMKSMIAESDVLFLTGGDPNVLMDALVELNLTESMKKFRGLIVGFSAGGMVLSNKYVIPAGMDKNYPKMAVEDGLGLVSFAFVPHYDESLDDELCAGASDVELYAIPNSSALFFDVLISELVPMGQCTHFMNGSKC